MLISSLHQAPTHGKNSHRSLFEEPIIGIYGVHAAAYGMSWLISQHNPRLERECAKKHHRPLMSGHLSHKHGLKSDEWAILNLNKLAAT